MVYKFPSLIFLPSNLQLMSSFEISLYQLSLLFSFFFFSKKAL
uniref:Uncharacterized protein n=1 Tax=Rhizophora mucronata TaxID=61149 RepID=A0A2P2QI25_RHIMU